MCGSSPEPEAVTASTGTCDAGGEAVLAAVLGRRSRTAASSSSFVGPRFEAELAIAS